MSAGLPVVVAGLLGVAAAGLLWLPPVAGPPASRPGGVPVGARPRRFRVRTGPRPERDGPVSTRTRVTAAVSLLAVGNLALGPGIGTLAGLAAAIGIWTWLRRQEPPAEARRRARLAADMPHAVDLFAALLRAGQAPAQAAGLVGRTLEGPAGETMAAVSRRAGAGLDAYAVWRPLAEEEATALLG